MIRCTESKEYFRKALELLEKEEEDKNQYIEGDEDYGEYFNEDSEDFDEGHDMAEFMDFDFDDSMEYKPNYGQYKRID